MPITASKLYDYLQCNHRVWRDAYGPQEERSEEKNAFVTMLWEKGVQYEKETIANIGVYEDLSQGNLKDRANKTLEAMRSGVPLIYQGVLQVDDLLGIPDLLRLQSDQSYVPIDIKSGMAFEDGEQGGEEDDGKPKKHYAVQLALYADALLRMGFGTKREGLIFDVKGNEVRYILDESMGIKTPQTFWEFYEQTRENVGRLLRDEAKNDPAIGGVCKLCPWYGSCKKWAKDTDDLTGMFDLGRSKRDVLREDAGVRTITEAQGLDVPALLLEKKRTDGFLPGFAEKTLSKVLRRARIFSTTKQAVLYEAVSLPDVAYEVFFDIEDDPTQEFVYMHGVYERGPDGERYLDFTAKELGPLAEKAAWSDFWIYIRSLPAEDYAVYYYSPHEKSTYRRLRKKYPDVISEDELEEFFENKNVIDLYHEVVLKKTDWPLGSYSIKAIANYLGFSWRDKTPSGALSIQWFNDYIKSKDPQLLERIRLYNEDDCKATMVLKDAISRMPVTPLRA